MSLESGTGAIERSALEGKDRDELVTIAGALGGKPPARAKKADIVDLILDLAGVARDGAAVDEAPKRSRSRARAPAGDRGADRVEDEAERSSANDDERGGSRGGSGEEQGARQQRDRDERADQGEGRARQGGQHEGNGRNRDEGDQQGGNQQGGNQQSGNQADQQVPNQGGNQGNQNQQGGNQRAQNQQGGNQGNQNQQGGHQSNQHQGGNQGAQNQQGGNQGNQHQGGNQGSEGNQHGGQQDGEGNRRRRRRGRERERGNQPDEPFTGEPVPVEGLLDLRDDGYGFLRIEGFLPSRDDAYVSVKQVRQFSLRKGDHVKGASRPANRNEKNPALLRIDEVNGTGPDQARNRPRFEDLTPLFPDERLRLERPDTADMTSRIVDLVSPIGKGQRGLIVSPPKAGKTTVMKQIARSIETNNPDVHLIVLLVDERPEEVTDMRRWVKGEVAASTFDRPSDEHTQVAELTIERAKRMVEDGKDVVIMLDGITRLSRAYNLAAPATGRIMSGGIDTGALYPPKKFFGAARNLEEGGSLTILATALVETGSRMDEVIFEEFKGTGNMELRLDRRLAERRIYPAIDVDASSTRHEELLFPRNQLQQVWKLRRVLSGLAGEGASGAAGLELLMDRMKTFKNNDEFLAEIAKAPSVGA